MPVAAQHEMPFTQVLAPERKLSQQTGGPGWYSWLWLGLVFLHSGEEMDGQRLHPWCLSNLEKKKIVGVSCYCRFSVYKSVEDRGTASSMVAHLFEGAAEAWR